TQGSPAAKPRAGAEQKTVSLGQAHCDLIAEAPLHLRAKLPESGIVLGADPRGCKFHVALHQDLAARFFVMQTERAEGAGDVLVPRQGCDLSALRQRNVDLFLCGPG